MPRPWLPSPAEVYTIQGNSHGKPCTIPFKYDNQWFHGCTSTGREDGHLWCATTQDYGKDERWGFCPIKSESGAGGAGGRLALGDASGWRNLRGRVGSGLSSSHGAACVESLHSWRDPLWALQDRAGEGPTLGYRGGR